MGGVGNQNLEVNLHDTVSVGKLIEILNLYNKNLMVRFKVPGSEKELKHAKISNFNPGRLTITITKEEKK